MSEGLVDRLRDTFPYQTEPFIYRALVRNETLGDVRDLLRSDETREAIAEALAEWMDDYHDSAALAVQRVLTGLREESGR